MDTYKKSWLTHDYKSQECASCTFNLCDVRDLAHGTIAAADKGRKGECYILGNTEVTLKEVAHMLHEACGCKQPLF